MHGDLAIIDGQDFTRPLLGGVINKRHPVGPLYRGVEMAEATPIPAQNVLVWNVMAAPRNPPRDTVYGGLRLLYPDVQDMDGESLAPRVLHQAQDRRSSQRCLDGEAPTLRHILPLKPEHLPRCLRGCLFGSIRAQESGNSVGVKDRNTGRAAQCGAERALASAVRASDDNQGRPC